MNIKLCSTIIFLITIANTPKVSPFTLKLTKIICNSYDKTFAIFKTCRLKAVSRTLQYFTMYLKLLKVPITDVDARFAFLKRSNGYKPFLYDFPFKCDFLKKMNPVTKLVWGWFKDSTNLNHSCPFVEDFEMKRLENRYLEEKLQVLPLPPGDYCFYANVTTYGEHKFDAYLCGIIS